MEVFHNMSEPQNEGADQSAESQNDSKVDLSTIQNALMSEFDKRFSGIQSLLDRRTAEFQAELAQLKTADLSPEEQAQLAASEAQKRLAMLERENELLKQRKAYGEEVDFLEEFMKQPNLNSQLELLKSFRKAQAAAEAQGEEPAEQSTPVDMNNPPRRQELSLADVAGDMTSEMADKILGSAKEKGLLRRLRGG